jgi:hypothetical protein
VYLLLDENASLILPDYLTRFEAFPFSKLERVVKHVKQNAKPLSEERQEILAEVYEKLGVPMDQYLTHPILVERLTAEFKKMARSSVPGERLVRELLRLRKAGELPTVGRTTVGAGHRRG